MCPSGPTPAQERTPRGGYSGPSPGGFWRSPGWILLKLSGQPVPGLCQPHSEVFPDSQTEAPAFLFVSMPFCPGTGYQWKKPVSVLFVLFALSLQVFIHVDKICTQHPPQPCSTEPSLLQAEQSMLSQPLLHRRDAWVSQSSWRPYTGLLLVYPCVSYNGRPRIGHSTRFGLTNTEQRERTTSQPAGSTSPNATKNTTSLLVAKTHCWLLFSLVSKLNLL